MKTERSQAATASARSFPCSQGPRRQARGPPSPKPGPLLPQRLAWGPREATRWQPPHATCRNFAVALFRAGGDCSPILPPSASSGTPGPRVLSSRPARASQDRSTVPSPSLVVPGLGRCQPRLGKCSRTRGSREKPADPRMRI